MPINSRNVFMDAIKRRTLNRKNPNPGFPKQSIQPVQEPNLDSQIVPQRSEWDIADKSGYNALMERKKAEFDKGIKATNILNEQKRKSTQPVAPPQAPNAEPALREAKIAPIGRAHSKQPEMNHQIAEANAARDAANKMQEAMTKRSEWDITDKSASQIFGNEQKKAPTGNVPEANDVVDMQKRKSTQPVKPTTSAAKSAAKSSAMRKRTAII